MVTYILFEEMDVLGLRRSSRLANEAVAALEYTAIDAERLSNLPLPIEGPSNPSHSILNSLAPINVLRIAEPFATSISPINLRPVFARAHLGPQALSASTSPADPF
jgi:hypothetical protein